MNPDPGRLATKSAQGTLRYTRYFPFASQQSAPDLLQPDPTRKHHILAQLFHLPWSSLPWPCVRLIFLFHGSQTKFPSVRLTSPVAPSCLEAYRASGSHHPFPTLGSGSVNIQGGLTHMESYEGRSEVLQGVRDFTSSQDQNWCPGFAGEPLASHHSKDIAQVMSDAPSFLTDDQDWAKRSVCKNSTR